MRRSQLLILVTAVSLTVFVIMLAALTAAPVTALPAEYPLGAPADTVNQQLEMGEHLAALLPNDSRELSLLALSKIQEQPLEPLTTLQIEVDYSEDWVAGSTDAFASVTVTVTDGGEDPQETATVSANDSGQFFIQDCDNWVSGNCPDINPGDHVLAAVVGATAEITTVGSIVGNMDIAGDFITGTLNAGWLPIPAEVQCEIWDEAGPVITDTVDPNGGSFDCDFSGVWELQKFDNVALRYYEPDGDSVISHPIWPWSRVNYAHDWVGGNYDAGHTFWITVTDSSDGFKALNVMESQTGLGWGQDGFDTGETPWSPDQPNIEPNDLVYIVGDDGYTNTLDVGQIDGVLDIGADKITGTITASFDVSLTVECYPWGAWEQGMDVPSMEDLVFPDGTDQFECDWGVGSEWDIQPGQDVAVAYIAPDGDLIVDVYRGPPAYLGLDKWA